jgi:hypothetical protein
VVSTPVTVGAEAVDEQAPDAANGRPTVVSNPAVPDTPNATPLAAVGVPLNVMVMASDESKSFVFSTPYHSISVDSRDGDEEQDTVELLAEVCQVTADSPSATLLMVIDEPLVNVVTPTIM